MGVYIKGMEMPTSCYDCDFAYQDQDSEHNVYWTCAAVHKSACMHERREDCPLVPVPPHGRLIDAGKIGLTDFEIILCQKGNPFKNALEMLLEKIENAPTIIPAEEGET